MRLDPALAPRCRRKVQHQALERLCSNDVPHDLPLIKSHRSWPTQHLTSSVYRFDNGDPNADSEIKRAQPFAAYY